MNVFVKYVYDPAIGDEENGIAPGTAFADLPPRSASGLVSPRCGAKRINFEKVE